MRTRFLSRACLSLIAALAAVSVAAAQITTTGRLTGVVTDTQGAVIPKAEVVAVSDQTKQEFRATASDEGSWAIPSVPNGTYTVTVSAPNFKKTVLQDVKVDVGQPTSANATLEPGGANEQVVVAAAGEILQTESSSVSTTIVGRQIGELPFATRDALQLVLTLPGVQTPGAPRTSSINGLPKGSVNLTLDGANIQDNFLRSSDGFFTQIQPKSDAVQEVTVSTAVPGAESAGEGAVQVRFVTKSGTSEFHGGGFWQYRSPKFNSNYYFNNIDGLPRDILLLRQFGGNIGGPILIPKLIKSREKAFFFVNYEEFQLPQTYPSETVYVLTPAALLGNFTYAATRPANNAPLPNGCSATSVTTQMLCTVNVLSLAASKNFPGTIDPVIAQGLKLVDTGAHHRNSFSFVAAHRWTISNRLVNEVRATSSGNGTSLFTSEFAPGLYKLWNGFAVTGGTYLGNQPLGTGAFYNRRSTSRRNTPTKGVTDNVTMVHGTHTFNLGGSFLR